MKKKKEFILDLEIFKNFYNNKGFKVLMEENFGMPCGLLEHSIINFLKKEKIFSVGQFQSLQNKMKILMYLKLRIILINFNIYFCDGIIYTTFRTKENKMHKSIKLKQSYNSGSDAYLDLVLKSLTQMSLDTVNEENSWIINYTNKHNRKDSLLRRLKKENRIYFF